MVFAGERKAIASESAGLSSGERIPELSRRIQEIIDPGGELSRGVSGVAYFPPSTGGGGPKFRLRMSASAFQYLDKGQLEALSGIFSVEAGRLQAVVPGSIPVAADKNHLIQGAFVSFELEQLKRIVGPEAEDTHGGSAIAFHQPESGGAIVSAIASSGEDSPALEQVEDALNAVSTVNIAEQMAIELDADGESFGGNARAFYDKVAVLGGDAIPASVTRALWDFFQKPYSDGQGGEIVIGKALSDSIALLWMPIAGGGTLLCPVIGGDLVYSGNDLVGFESPLYITSSEGDELVSAIAMNSLDPKDIFVGFSGGLEASTSGNFVKAGFGGSDNFVLGYDADHSEIFATVTAQFSGDVISYVPEALDGFWALNSSAAGRSLYADGIEVATAPAVAGKWASDSLFSIFGGMGALTSPGWARGVVITNRALNHGEVTALTAAMTDLEAVRRGEAQNPEPEAPPPGDAPINTGVLVQAFEQAALAAGGTLSDWAIYIADASTESGNMASQGGIGAEAQKNGEPILEPFGSAGKNAYCFDGTSFFHIPATPDMDGGTWTSIVVASQSLMQGTRYIYNHSYSGGAPAPSGALDELWGQRGETFFLGPGEMVTFNSFRARESDGSAVDTDSRVPITQDLPFVSTGTWKAADGEIQQRLNENYGELGEDATAIPSGHQGSWIGAFDSGSGSAALRFHGCIAVVAWSKRIIPPEALAALTQELRVFYGLPLEQAEASFEVAPAEMVAAVTDNLAIAEIEVAPFELQVEIGAPPPAANDNIADAEIVATFPLAVSTNNFEATGEIGEPSHAGYGGGGTSSQSLWWRFSPVSSGTMNISTSGDVDTILVLYTGSGYGNLLEVASDWGNGGSDLQDIVVSGGLNYFIAVDTDTSERGSFSLSADFTAVSGPANDNFENAIAITSDTYSTTIDNTYATGEAGEPDQDESDDGNQSLWWSYTPEENGAISISLAGSSPDTVLAVYTGSAVNSLTRLAGPVDATSVISGVAVTTGQTYYIAADSYFEDTGNIVFTFNFFSASGDINDSFAEAEVITSDSFSGIYNTAISTGEPGEDSHAGSGLGDIDSRSLWWVYTPAVLGTATIDLLESDFDTVLAIYTGPDVANLSEIDSSDDGPIDSTSRIENVVLQPGTEYRIAADGYDGEVGTLQFSFEFTPVTPPPNNDFASAQVIGDYFEQYEISTIGATGEVGEPSHAGKALGGSDSKSVWYEFTPSQTGALTISTPSADFDALVALYTGSDISALTAIASDDDSGSGWTALINRVLVTAGTTYKIAIDGDSGANGTTGLISSFVPASPPPNDTFPGTVVDISTFPSLSGDTLFATGQTGEPAHASFALGGTASKSIWYTFTPASETFLLVDVSGSDFNAVVALYTGSSVDSLNFIVSGQGSFSTGIVPGTQYYLAVDGTAGDSGNASVSIIAF